MSADTFFLITVNIGVTAGVLLIRAHLKCFKKVVDTVSMLEFVAIEQHADLVKKWHDLRGKK